MHLKSSYVYLDIASFSACISTYIDILLKSSGSFTDNDATPHLVVADEAVLPHVGGEGGHPAAGRVEGSGVQAAEGHGGALPGTEVGCTVLYCTVLYCGVLYLARRSAIWRPDTRGVLSGTMRLMEAQSTAYTLCFCA